MGIQSLKRASRAAGYALVSAEDTFDDRVVMYPHLMLTHDPSASAHADGQRGSTNKPAPTVLVASPSRPPRPAMRISQYFTWKPTTA
ncbi:MAG: hypothetical protein AAFR55_03650 [Pseudomonadota bacterium]